METKHKINGVTYTFSEKQGFLGVIIYTLSFENESIDFVNEKVRNLYLINRILKQSTDLSKS